MHTDGSSRSTAAADPWRAGNQIVVRATEGGAVCTWRFEIGAGDDLRLVLDEHSPHGDRSGELVVVAGAALLSRGVTLAPGAEIDAIDGPGLVLQLVFALLGRALPGGPAAVAARAAIDLEERHDAIALETPGAVARFEAPWRVLGELHRIDPTTLGFELGFAHGRGTAGGAQLRLSGTWARATPAPALDDGMSLEGWQVSALGAHMAGGAVDYRARVLDARAGTLGQLRAQLAARGSPA